MINKIGKITLYVEDQATAKSFWTEKMNFVVKFEQPMGPNMTWLEVGPSEDEFTTFVLYDKKMMQQQNPSTNIGHPSILLSTTDLNAAHEQMQANGVLVEPILKMPYGSMFKFKDQDGNDFILREDK